MRALVITLLVLAAVVVQTAVLAAIGLPAAVPDLTLVVVVAVALVAGADTGAVTGCAAGLLTALVPTGAGPVGAAALVYAITGYLVGSWLAGHPMRWFDSAAVVAVVVAIANTALLMLTAILADGPGFAAAVGSVLSQLLYSALLAVAVLPVVAAALRTAPARA